MPKTSTDKLKFGLLLFLTTTLLSFLVFISNILRCNIIKDMDIQSWIYYILSALGHASQFSLVLFVLLYIPISHIFKNYKIATAIYTFFAILLQIIFVLDNFVFTIYRFHLNGFILELIAEGGSEIFVFDFWVYLKFIILILFAAIIPYIIAIYISKKTAAKLTRKQIITACAILASCLMISHIGHAVAAAYRQPSIQKSATALPFFFPLTMNSLLDKIGLINKDEIDNIRYNEPSSNIQYPTHPLQTSDHVPMHNIIYIVIDSWNPRTLDPINMPNIYKFSQTGNLFKNHQSSSNSTRGGIFGLFFGLSCTYEKEFNITKTSPLIIDKLIDLKYNIQTFPSATLTIPPFNETIFRRVPNINLNSQGDSPFERDIHITNEFVKHLDKIEKDKPFFSFLFYDLLHAIAIPKEHQSKYQPSWTEADYMKLNNNIDPTPFFNLYKNCAFYTDSLIGVVIKNIENKGLLDNTMIVITADHGQEFNENRKNYWGHSSNFSQWQTNVPLVIYYPGIEPNKQYTHLTTNYDITPTVMSKALGVKNPTSDYSMGYDIYDTINRIPFIIGNQMNYGFILQNAIITTNHVGTMSITDKHLNDLPRNAINIKELQEVIALKNRFYK